MKVAGLILVCLIVGCSGNNSDSKSGQLADTLVDSTAVKGSTDAAPEKTYHNQRFRNVTVATIGPHTYRVEGEGQIFEANFGWVVEDGHRELKSGFEMTDAGAPAWGKFSFTIEVEKQRPNSTLTLVLFESSAKDGSRQHELPIPLE